MSNGQEMDTKIKLTHNSNYTSFNTSSNILFLEFRIIFYFVEFTNKTTRKDMLQRKRTQNDLIHLLILTPANNIF